MRYNENNSEQLGDLSILTNIQDEVRYLNMGATAINVSPYYLENIVN